MVEYISNSDIYEIKLASLISNVDKDVIVDLYQPLVGSQAIMLYLNLVRQKRNEDNSIENTYSTSQLLNVMQFAPGNMLSARHQLEAVGLMRTYETAEMDDRHYIYVMYAPKTPKDFFDDVLFKGLLIQYVGEKQAKKLANKYKINIEIPTNYREVSASFVDVFHPNYDDPAFKKNFGDSIVGHTAGRVQISFNYDLFFKSIEENSQILPSSFLKRDMKEIERLSALFGLNETRMAFIVIDCYDPYETPHIDFEKVAKKASDEVKYKIRENSISNEKSEVSGDTLIGKKIKMMESTSPVEWLEILQNGTKPAMADIKIVDGLSRDYGFNCGVINVIVEWSLEKNNNILSKAYCEKIASSLARSNVKTAIDAMNQLQKTSIRKSTVNVEKTTTSVEKVKQSNKIDSKKHSEIITDDEMNDILNMFDEQRNGGK